MMRVHRAATSLSAAALVLLLSALGAAAQAPPPPTVTVAAPLSKRITNWDEYWGRFEAVESVEVRARVSGFIDKIHFKDGQIVKAGDLLFTIDPRPFRIAVESAEAEVTRTKAQVSLGESEVERARPLLKSAAVTERDFEHAASQPQRCQGPAAVGRGGLKNAKLNLEWTEVRAPIAGRISDNKVDVGNLVAGGAAATTTLLTTIVSLDPIHFVFDAAEADYLRYTRMRTERRAGVLTRCGKSRPREACRRGGLDRTRARWTSSTISSTRGRARCAAARSSTTRISCWRRASSGACSCSAARPTRC